MYNFLVILSIIVCCSAGGGSYGGSSRGSSGTRYGTGGGGGTPNIIPAAVIFRQTIEFRDVDTRREQLTPQIIEVNAGVLPLTILFKSASSALKIVQSHDGSRGGEKETSSDDEPYRLFHTVTKPIIQEVREVISPFRRIVQEIQPVEEDVKTIIARGRDTGIVTGIGNGEVSITSIVGGGGVFGGLSSTSIGSGVYGRIGGKSY